MLKRLQIEWKGNIILTENNINTHSMSRWRKTTMIGIYGENNNWSGDLTLLMIFERLPKFGIWMMH